MEARLDHYRTLGLTADADPAVIRSAYRALMRRQREEAGSGVDPLGRATLINAAYEVLSDPAKRAAYDAIRHRAEDPPAPATVTTPDEPKSVEIEAADFRTPDSEASQSTTGDASSAPLIQSTVYRPPAELAKVAAGVFVTGLVLLGAIHALSKAGAPAATGASGAALGGPAVSSNGATKFKAAWAAAKEIPPNVMLSWQSKEAGDPVSYRVGQMLLTISSDNQAEGRTPVLSVQLDGQEPFRLNGQVSSLSPFAGIGVGRIDPSADGDQIIFSTYSGGAHCCSDIKVVEHRVAGWRIVDLGSYDGEPLGTFPVDRVHDGGRVFVLQDDAFDYQFASHAESWPPPKIIAVRDGKAIDVSRDRRFKPVYRDFLARSKTECERGNNSACAGFVAAAARTGLLDWSWGVMLEHYDRQSTWLPAGCQVPLVDSACPPGAEQKFSNFPDALRWFLTEHRYFAPVPATNGTSQTGPSFDCSRVTSANLLLICVNPDLAAADRELSVAYRHALSTTADPDRLKRDQRAWIVARNNGPADPAAIAAAYARRIAELQGVLD